MSDAPQKTEILTLLRKVRASLYGYYLSAGGDEEARTNGTLKADGRLIDSIDRFIDTSRKVAGVPQPSAIPSPAPSEGVLQETTTPITGAKVKAAIAALYDDAHGRQTPPNERIAVALDYLESALHQCPATKSVGDEGVAECQRDRAHDGPHISGDLGWEEEAVMPQPSAIPSPAPAREIEELPREAETRAPTVDPLDPPCPWCGYNGADYWQTGSHTSGCPWRNVGGETARRRVLQDAEDPQSSAGAPDSELVSLLRSMLSDGARRASVHKLAIDKAVELAKEAQQRLVTLEADNSQLRELLIEKTKVANGYCGALVEEKARIQQLEASLARAEAFMADASPKTTKLYRAEVERVERLEAENAALRERERKAWEAGFQLCRSYGDNWTHFEGEQKERHWQAYQCQQQEPTP